MVFKRCMQETAYPLIQFVYLHNKAPPDVLFHSLLVLLMFFYLLYDGEGETLKTRRPPLSIYTLEGKKSGAYVLLISMKGYLRFSR